MNLKERLRIAGGFSTKHLAASALIAVLCGALVFGLWYPYPYSELASGRELFALLISVDLAIEYTRRFVPSAGWTMTCSGSR